VQNDKLTQWLLLVKSFLFTYLLLCVIFGLCATAHCPNFVTMATRVGRSEIQMTQFDCPTPKTPCLMESSWIYL